MDEREKEGQRQRDRDRGRERERETEGDVMTQNGSTPMSNDGKLKRREKQVQS